MDTILNEGKGLDEARQTWRERNPMGRMGVPEELTGAVVLLCCGAGSYINGADLVVDGGQVCTFWISEFCCFLLLFTFLYFFFTLLT